jgi:inorganic pyrophosphatase
MKVVIEIPKGDDRRRHLKYDKTGFIDLGPIRDKIPVNEGICPAHYGLIPGTKNEKEGDEIDVIVLSDHATSVGQEIEVEPIGILMRADGDDKVIAVDASQASVASWADVPKDERELMEKFFCHSHKLISIEDAKAAKAYIQKGLT